MKAVILCGGKGTRIRDVSELLPKPMLPIGEHPILWHIMKSYAHHGITDFVLCLGHQGWKIKEYFLNYQAMNSDFTVDLSRHGSLLFHNGDGTEDWRVTLADTGIEAMTGARLFRVRKYLEGEQDFCLTYGDGVGDVNITALVEFHRAHGKVATVTGVRPSSRFGEIVVEDGMVTSFNEKPTVSAGWINGGFMVFDGKRVWDYLWPEEHLSLETEPLPAMAKDRQLMTYQHHGFWQYMDTLREYTLLNDMWHEGRAPWKIWSR